MFVDSHLSGYELENEDKTEHGNSGEVYAISSLFIYYYCFLLYDKLHLLEEASLFVFLNDVQSFSYTEMLNVFHILIS